MAGTSLIQAFAMQLPDVAAGMNAGAAGGSKFATFLGGPWGIALTSAIGLAATFATKLFDTDDAAKKSEKSQRSFADVLGDSKSSWDDITKAAKAYADQQEKNRQLTFDEIRSEAALTAERLRGALAIREKLQADLEAYEAISRRGAQSEAGDVARQGSFARADRAREMIAKNSETLKQLTRSANEATIKAAEAIAELNVDPARKIRVGYEELERQAKNRFASARELTDRLTELGKGEEVALDRLNNSSRKHVEETLKLAKVTGAEIAKVLGAPITSGFRTAARNKEVGGDVNSHHLTGTAIDIPLSVGGKPFTKAGIRAALEPLGVQIKELLGPGDRGHNDHFHIAFGIKRLASDQVSRLADDAAEAARKAADKAENEMQKFRMGVLETNLKMGELFTKTWLPGFVGAQAAAWDQFMSNTEKAANAGVKGAGEASAAFVDWNDELRRTVDLLDNIGASGRGLGDIAAMLVGLTSGDFSGSRGPLGSLMQTLGNTQWRDPADSDGLGKIHVLREEIVGGLDKVFGGDGTFAKSMNGALQGAGMGMAAGGLLGKQTTVQKIGSAIGGTAGKALGTALGGPLGGAIGSIAGGILGSVAGGLFKTVKWGRADVSSAGAMAGGGNSGAAEKAAIAAGNSVFSSLTDLAAKLGGSVGDFGNISVGTRHGDYRVNTTGTSLKVKKGAKDFDDDAEAAALYAIQQAINRGAISGIRASTGNLLKAGDDLQANLDKALQFEGVFADLKSRTDPIAAELESVTKQFDQLRAVFKQAGASAGEYAQLEQLLALKRDDVMKKERDALDDVKVRLARTQGNEAAAVAIERQQELAGALTDTVRAELRRLYAVEDATTQQQKLTDEMQKQTSAAQELRDAWSAIGKDLLDEVNRIRGLTGTEAGGNFAMLQGQFNSAIAAARSGDKDAAGRLVELSQSLITVAGNTATSRQELDRIKAQTAASLEGVYGLIGAITGSTASSSPVSVLAAAANAQTATSSTASNDNSVAAAIADVRSALDQLRADMNSGLAATANNTGRTAKVLENVSPDGDVINVGQARA